MFSQAANLVPRQNGAEDGNFVEEVNVVFVVSRSVLRIDDAMDDNGRLWLTLDEVEIDEETAEALPEATSGRFAQLTVSDTGCGMDDSTLARAFEPFFTTKDIGAGTGLGLATVYGIVSQHRGWVRVTSQPGERATFHIHLPLVDADIAEALRRWRSVPISRGRKRSFSPRTSRRFAVVRNGSLTRADYTVVAAKDGRAALEKWEAREGDFEVLVSDVLMPKMSGIELARKLTACKPDLRVLLISGYSGDEFDLKELDEVGAAFINKPVTQEILLSRVRELADKIPVGS